MTGPSPRSTIGIVFLVLALVACRNAVTKPVTGPSPCSAETFEGASFTDCTMTRTDGELRLYTEGADGSPLRSLAALKAMLGAEAAQVRFAMNAGMFDADGRPIGLYIAAGQVVKPLNRNRGPGNFHMMPNGVFSVEADGFHIRTTDAFVQIAAGTALYATQSGPMLVIDGRLHPQISRDGSSLNIRNAVGVDRAGKAHFVISDDPVSFGKIARYLREAKGCPNALFLDGTVSALWDPAQNRMDGAAPIGPMIVSIAAKP